MKKVILSLGLLVGLASAANAQEIHFGVKAGASLSSLSGDNTGDAKSTLGFVGGLAANFGFSDLISLQPELLYSMKGFKQESGSDKINSHLNYLDIPVLLKVNADGLFFEAGPQIGFLLSQKTTFDIQGQSIPDNTSTTGLRKTDLGYVVGLGYQLSSGPSIGIRYNGGISDISDPSVTGDKQRNSVFQLQLGYMFGGK
ncbi:porin family protein [Hymenobacter negativus]|uniref:PorT family protein n=1 Tax=Hymenobacter negativus TaxID=2795026 RepID=A0ABS3QLD1_9BACT|nr:porin family protein [Hymenobacter negativus]MBO2012061.1 PorT family protein [Hymenobacter negativus]